MKQIIIIIMLVFVGVQVSAQMSLKDLENRYIEKAEALKTDYENKSVSLAKSYVKALEVKKVEYTKKGDLDNALKVRQKIEEIKATLNKENKSVKSTPKTINGTWVMEFPTTEKVFYKISGTSCILIKQEYKGKTETLNRSVKMKTIDGLLVLPHCTGLKTNHFNFKTMTGYNLWEGKKYPFTLKRLASVH